MGRRTDRRKLLAGIAAPLLLGAFAPAALAGIDASGPWATTVTTSPPTMSLSCTLFVAQAGSALSASGSCLGVSLQSTGTIDSTTGAFTLSGFEPFFCGNTVTLSGTVARDARTFTAVGECPIPVFPYPVDIAGSRCGNGVLDPGEVCDDGNQVDGDCCSATCDSLAPEGTSCGFTGECEAQRCDSSGTCQFVVLTGPCDDFNDCTTNDTCTTFGFCQGQPVADGTSCDDGDQCTTGDTCNFGFCSGQEVDCGPCKECDSFEGGCIPQEPQPFCSLVPPGRSTLRVRDDPADKKDVVSWRLAPDAGISIGDLGDPRSFTSYQVCVYDEVFESHPFFFGNLLAGVGVPAGGTCGDKPCWTPKRNGYRYTDKSGASDGVRSLDLEAGDGKSASLSVFAKGPSVGIAPLPAELPVLVQIQSSDGLCWQANFPQARLNGPLELRARIPGSPSGAFVE
jgi:cysteine-rich repeat protein